MRLSKKLFLILIPIFFVILVLVIGAVILLSRSSEESTPTEEKMKIATTIFPIYDITKNIAHNDVEVVQLLPNGASPHTYEPTINDIKAIEDAEVLFVIGHGLDDWASELVEGLNVEIVELSENIELMEGEHHDEHEEEGEDHGDEDDEDEDHEGEDENTEEGTDEHEEKGDEHDEEALDPHYWLSIENAKKMSFTIYNTLKEEDPDNTDMYTKNYQEYIRALGTLQTESLEKLASISNREIITFHDAFGYFANDFDLEVVATIEPFAGKEPTPQYLAEIGELIEEHKITVLFSEPQLSDTVTEALADDYNAKVFVLDPLGGVEGRNSYIDLIKYNVTTISEAYST